MTGHVVAHLLRLPMTDRLVVLKSMGFTYTGELEYREAEEFVIDCMYQIGQEKRQSELVQAVTVLEKRQAPPQIPLARNSRLRENPMPPAPKQNKNLPPFYERVQPDFTLASPQYWDGVFDAETGIMQKLGIPIKEDPGHLKARARMQRGNDPEIVIHPGSISTSQLREKVGVDLNIPAQTVPILCTERGHARCEFTADGRVLHHPVPHMTVPTAEGRRASVDNPVSDDEKRDADLRLHLAALGDTWPTDGMTAAHQSEEIAACTLCSTGAHNLVDHDPAHTDPRLPRDEIIASIKKINMHDYGVEYPWVNGHGQRFPYASEADQNPQLQCCAKRLIP